MRRNVSYMPGFISFNTSVWIVCIWETLVWVMPPRCALKAYLLSDSKQCHIYLNTSRNHQRPIINMGPPESQATWASILTYLLKQYTCHILNVLLSLSPKLQKILQVGIYVILKSMDDSHLSSKDNVFPVLKAHPTTFENYLITLWYFYHLGKNPFTQ